MLICSRNRAYQLLLKTTTTTTRNTFQFPTCRVEYPAVLHPKSNGIQTELSEVRSWTRSRLGCCRRPRTLSEGSRNYRGNGPWGRGGKEANIYVGK